MKARDNPFSTDRVLRIRYDLQHDTWPNLLARLEHFDYRAAIVGPHGAGKTTLLEDLQEKLEARGTPTLWLRLDHDHPKFDRATLDTLFARLTPNHIICLDGAEQLSRLPWLLFNRRTRPARGLVITSHKAGLLPTLIECTTTPELLGDIVARLSSGTIRRVDAPKARDLFQKHQGDLRAALREMYDWYASI
jgi:GTPase SAR1 family protein